MLRILICLLLLMPCEAYPQFPEIINISNHSENVRIVYETEDDKDNFGSDLAIGDFNGDGYNDILAGAYGYSDRENFRFNVGRAYVIFGGPNLPPLLDLCDPKVEYVRITGDDPRDNTGWSVGAGDVNGDGIADAIIGDLQVGALVSPGKLYIVWGRESWPASFNLDTDGKAVEGVMRILGKEASDSFGGMVTIGDTNGDGYADIVTSAANIGHDDSLRKSGEVYVVYGQDSYKSVLTITIDDPSLVVSTIHSVKGWSIGQRGYCTDINQDGYSDVLLGNANLTRIGSGELVGIVKIFYGSNNWPTNLYIHDQNIQSGQNIEIIGEANELLGSRFGVGDVNGNGVNDLLLSSTWNYKLHLLLDLPEISEKTPPIEVKNYPNKLILTQFGEEGDLAVADLNADGYADLITASPLAPINGKRNGRAYIIYGAENLPDSLNMSNKSDLRSTTQILNSQITTRFGYAIATGDMNGDGIDDVVLSDYEAHTIGGASPGEIYIIYGRSVNSQRPPVETSVILQNFPNPFNANTVIRYRLESPQHVRIAVYNALGQEVRRLVEGMMPEGEHKAIWDGYDASFRQVGSGVYFCRLTGESVNQSIKLLYLR